MRSVSDGGLRKAAKAEAAKGAPLKGSANGSKAQKLMLLKQTEAAAERLKHVHLLKRGPTGIRSRLRAARRKHREQRDSLAEKKINSLALRRCPTSRHSFWRLVERQCLRPPRRGQK